MGFLNLCFLCSGDFAAIKIVILHQVNLRVFAMLPHAARINEIHGPENCKNMIPPLTVRERPF